MRKRFVGILIILLACGCVGIPEKDTNTIRDLIHPLRLVAGETFSLPAGDLFYAETYDLKFDVHPRIEINYDETAETLTLKPDDHFEGLTLIPFRQANQSCHLPVFSKKRSLHTFSCKPPNRPEKITLFGSFNSWNRNDIPMTDPDNDGVYEAAVPLDPGKYEYRFMIDGEETIDPVNPSKIPNPFGEYNSLLIMRPRHKDNTCLHFLNADSTEKELRLHFFYERENQSQTLTHEHITALKGNRRLTKDRIHVTDTRISLHLDLHELDHEQIIRIAVTQNGLATPFQTVRLSGIRKTGDNGPSFSWHDGILYSIVVDRFNDGDPSNNRPVQHDNLSPKANYHGGDLQGIIDKLKEGYFTKLGVNVIWLSPIVKNTRKAFREYPAPHRYFTGYHGYWPVHHKKVDDRFGDMKLFKELIREAHNRDIRVLLDFVVNHVHEDHPFYRKHPEWFGQLDLPDGRKNIRFWDEYRLTTWFDTFLPSFDFQGSEDALEIMTDNGVWWIKKSGIDGFRQDAVKHVPNTFWRLLTRKIKREIEAGENRKIYQIGETFGSYGLISSYVNNGQLDAQFNFQIYDLGLYTFLTPDADFGTLDAEMKKTFDVYGVNHLMGNPMDSHDKVRFMAYADEDLSLGSSDAVEAGWNNPPRVDHPENYRKAELYLAFILTIPGIPVIYYGDEIGMTGAADPDNRRPMRFGSALTESEKKMSESVSRLIHLRKNYSALRRGDFLTLMAKKTIYAYIRSDIDERILVVLNKGERQETVSLNLPAFYQLKTARDLRSGESHAISGNRFVATVPETGWQCYYLE